MSTSHHAADGTPNPQPRVGAPADLSQLPTRLQSISVEDRGYKSACWVWTRRLDRDGYGQICWQRRTRGVHRLVYELLVDTPPSDLEVDHLCRVRSCCNPAHMELVTHKENQHRGVYVALKTHCKNGHEWVPKNLYRRPKGNSKSGIHCCRPCNLAAVKRYQQRTGRRTSST